MSHRYNIKYSLDTRLANQTAAKGVVMIVCRTEIGKMAECLLVSQSLAV